MSFTLDQLLSDIDVQHLIEPRLQLSIEVCIDIASHIAAGQKLPITSCYWGNIKLLINDLRIS